MEDFGFKIEEWYDESCKDEDDGFTIPDNLQHVYWANDIAEELSNADKIEIKLIPAEEYSEFELHFKLKADGWMPLVCKPIKGRGIIGAWKELLTLLKEDFEDRWLQWKERFELSKEEWAVVGQSVREMMEHDCIPQEIDYFISQFVNNKGKNL